MEEEATTMDLNPWELKCAKQAITRAAVRARDMSDERLPAPCRRIAISPMLDGSWGTCHLDVIDAQPVPGKYRNLPDATTLAYRLYHHPDGGSLVVAAMAWAWEDGTLHTTVFNDNTPCRQYTGMDAHKALRAILADDVHCLMAMARPLADVAHRG